MTEMPAFSIPAALPPAAGEAAIERLWLLWRQTGSLEYRNDLLMRYIGLVRRVVSRLFPASRAYHDHEDLISCGVIGLMNAIDRFDAGKGARFETYAQIRIRGEIIDYMRRQDWAPVHVRTRIKQIEAAYEQIAQQKGRPATDQEVAARLDISLDELSETMGDAHFLNILHLEDLLTDSADEDSSLMAEAQFDRVIEKKEIQALLAREIGKLSEREQTILNLYYYDELTLKEIGTVVGLTESRISQIHSGALFKLRTRMERQLRLPAARC